MITRGDIVDQLHDNVAYSLRMLSEPPPDPLLCAEFRPCVIRLHHSQAEAQAWAVIVELAPRLLTWDDVDPARHPFDSTSAPHVVRSLGPAHQMPSRPDIPNGALAMSDWSWSEGKPWADAMAYALAEYYSRWAASWRWAHDAGRACTSFALNADAWKAERPRREQPARPATLHRPGDRRCTGGDTETTRSSAPPGSGSPGSRYARRALGPRRISAGGLFHD